MAHPAVPLKSIVANLQIEMLGRPDAMVPPQTLWLTGYDRSNLGPELARRGAKIVADPRPSQNFFQRSDNYTLGAPRVSWLTRVVELRPSQGISHDGRRGLAHRLEAHGDGGWLARQAIDVARQRRFCSCVAAGRPTLIDYCQ